MSLKLVKSIVNPRHGIVLIVNEDDIEVARLTVRPVFFYKEKKKNFEDYNVPAYAELKLGAIVCSNEFASMEELHASFLEGGMYLMENVDYNMLIVSTAGKEMYDLYKEMTKELLKKFSSIKILENTESQALLKTWPENVIKGLNVTTNGVYKDVFFIMKKDSLETYKGEWWNESQEILENEKTA
jgi:hypothetical protein